MNTRYQHPALRQLAEQQVRYAPVDIRIEQMDQAERLLHELDPQSSYRYADLCERITAYRPSMYPDLKIDGSTAIHDLRVLVEDLSASADLPVESAREAGLDRRRSQRTSSTSRPRRWTAGGSAGLSAGASDSATAAASGS